MTDMTEVFRILGIEETKDERRIKQAYRDKLAVTNPEDDPEGFKRLRAAYEEACHYAKGNLEQEKEEADDSESGRWVAKAAELYANIHHRQDVKAWKALFEEEIFVSFEGEEECRRKLLVFLMTHFRLPSDIWNLLEQKLNIVKDVPALKEQFPVDFVQFIVRKCERGEDVDFSAFEGPEEGDYDLFLQYYDRCWQAMQNDDLKLAEEMLQAGEELGIKHPVMEINRVNLYVKEEKLHEAIAYGEKVMEKYPRDLVVNYNMAELFWNRADDFAREDSSEDADFYQAKSAMIYKKLKEENDTHYMANYRLTEWYCRQGEYHKAKECASKVLESGADEHFREILRRVNEQLEKELLSAYQKSNDYHQALEIGWCYLQDGKYWKGLRLVKPLADRIEPDKQAEYLGLLSKLYIEEAMYEEAADMSVEWEKALEKKLAAGTEAAECEKDKNRIRQSHLIRMQCYRQKGYVEKEYYTKALEEANKSEEGNAGDIGLLLEKAQIYMEMEEYEQCRMLVERIVDEFQVYAAYVTLLEAYRRQWNAGGVVQTARKCIDCFPKYARAYEHMAKVYLDLKRPEDLQEVLKEAKDKGVESVLLEAYAYQSTHQVPEDSKLINTKLSEFRKQWQRPLEEGKLPYYEKGLPVLTELLYQYPGTYMLVERGIFHREAEQLEAAKQDFEKALEENPAQPYALNGLSYVYKRLGDYEKALVYLRKAIRYLDEEDRIYRYEDMGDLFSLLGDYESAVTYFEKEAGAEAVKHRYGERMRKTAECLAQIDRMHPAAKKIDDKYGISTQGWFRKKSEMYLYSGEEHLAEEIMRTWKLNLKRSMLDKDYKEKLSKYYNARGWQALLYGSGKDAVKYFQKQARYSPKNRQSAYTELVFACFLYQEDSLGVKYAGLLKQEWNKRKLEESAPYLHMECMEMFYRLLISLYLESEEEQIKLLERIDSYRKCDFCILPVCKEMAAIKYIVLVRKGRQEEAERLLEAWKEAQPYDEYWRAIENKKLRK